MSITIDPLYPTMPREQLISWAEQNKVSHALDSPAKMLLVPTSRIHTSWLWVYKQNNTKIIDIITRPSAHSEEDITASNAPLDFQEAAIKYLHDSAITAQKAQTDEIELLLRPMPHNLILRTIWDNLLMLRNQIRLTIQPRSRQDRHTQQLWLDHRRYRLQYKEETVALCGGGGWVNVHIYLDGRANPINCTCQSLCRLGLSALDQTLEMLSDNSYSSIHDQITRLIGTPKWQKDFELLDKILIQETTIDANAKIGWRIKDTKQGLSIESVSCKHSKTGWRQKKAAVQALAHIHQYEHLSDEMLNTLSTQNSPTLVPTMLTLLTTHPRVFLGGRSNSTTLVIEEQLSIHFRNTPIGIEWDLMAGNITLSPQEILNQVDKNKSGYWYSTTQYTCIFVKINNKIQSFMNNLSSVSKIIPRDAVAALYMRIPLMESILSVHLDPSLLGAEHPPENRPSVRITTATPQHLRLEILVHSFGDSTNAIGKGKPLIYNYDPKDETFSYCNRSFEKESELANALRDLLELPLNDGFQWVVTNTNNIFKVLSTLKNCSSTTIHKIEWLTKRPTILNLQSSNLTINIFNTENNYEISGTMVSDDSTLTLWDILPAVRKNKPYLLVKEHIWYTIEEHFRNTLAQIADTITPENGLMSIEKSHAIVLNNLLKDQQGNHTVLSTELRKIQPISIQTTDFPYQLRPYQQKGVEWMLQLQQWTTGGCLADEMGLGKTIQTLAFLKENQAYPTYSVIIVAPKSTLGNWLKECTICLQDWSISIYQGNNRDRLLTPSTSKQCLIMTYDILTRDVGILNKQHWNTLVLDEAQAVKNPHSARSQSVHLLKRDFTLALTGTPIENSLMDLWSIISIVAPNHLGPLKQFKLRFATPIQLGQTHRLDDLKQLIHPFLLRRQKEHVAPDLPEKIEINEIIPLSTFERDSYDLIRLQAKQILEENPGQARFLILASLTKLRQICCYRGLVVPATSEQSSKLDRAIELLQEFQKSGRKVLIFSQFVRLLKKLQERIEGKGFSYCYLDGSTPSIKREQEIERFQSTKTDIFLISLKAGGNGINLTAATEVIHLDPWWNPAVEDQASDRAHRIGQTKTVTVIRLLAENTIETHILRLQEEKRRIADNILSDNISSLSLNEIQELLD